MTDPTQHGIQPDTLSLADCQYRVAGEPRGLRCQLAARFAELPVQQCEVAEQACRFCMSRPVTPETPNDVVASMALNATRSHAPNKMKERVRQLSQFLQKAEMPSGQATQRAKMADMPCVHRGEFLRNIECELCGSKGVMIEVHRCKAPGLPDDQECVASRWHNDPSLQPNRRCLGCPDQVAPAAERIVQIELPAAAPPAESTREGVAVLPVGDSGGKPYLSIVMATHTDYDGVWFTIQILRSFFPQTLADTNAEIVVVDTNPDSPHGKEVRGFVEHWCNGDDDDSGSVDRVKGRYFAAGHLPGTAAPRDWGIRQARGEVVLVIDCHVIPQRGSLPSLVEYFRKNPESIDLVHGPLLMDNFRVCATQMNPVWGEDNMFGKWGITDGTVSPNGKQITATDPFEIPMHGLGLFACRKVAWRGFNPLFRGFGGEEGYIHEKFRQEGGKVICLPELTWLHRFGRPGGIPYRNAPEDRFRNYLIGALETGGGFGRDVPQILERFAGISEGIYGRTVAEAMKQAKGAA